MSFTDNPALDPLSKIGLKYQTFSMFSEGSFPDCMICRDVITVYVQVAKHYHNTV